MNQKVDFAQFLWIGIKGKALSDQETEFIKSHPPGGVILFTRNYENPEQIYNLNKSIQNLCCDYGHKTPAFIGVDMEGGRVQRLKEPFTVWPSMKKLAEIDSTTKAYEFGLAMGKELKSVGINMDFSPCVDTILNDKNDVIGDRSFGDNPETVGKFGSAVIRGFTKSGVKTCVKHFPGHGYSSVDSHEALPVDERSYEEIDDINAFKISLKAKPTFLMPGHLMLPKIDPEFPVPLSKIWIKDILFEKLNCKALVISDDLEMGAMNKFNFKDSVLKIYELGFHQLLFCHGHEKAQEALEILNENTKLDQRRLKIILDQKQGDELLPPESFDNSHIGHKDHKELAKIMNEGVRA